MRVLAAILALSVTGLLTQAGLGRQQDEESLDKVRSDLAAKRAVLIDVREQKEWDRGHLQDAQLVPLSQLKRWSSDPAVKQELAKRLPNDRLIYCHCAKGVRAATAGDILKKLGYEVRPLKAGFDDLRQAGFPVAQPAAPGK